MDSGEETHSKKPTRKLIKRRKPQRHSSVQYPERLQAGDDAQDDVTAPKGNMPQIMNQSVFSMIAAAGSKSDFHARFDDDSSGSEDEPDLPKLLGIAPQSIDQPTIHTAEESRDDTSKKSKSEKDGKKRHESRLRRSLPKLNLRTAKEKNYMSQSTILQPARNTSPRPSPNVATPRDAPVMSRMLEAQAKMTSSGAGLGGKTDTVEASETSKPDKPEATQASNNLVTRLMEIFGFEKPEEVISGGRNIIFYLFFIADFVSEYPCWLLQSVLLQGYMYITEHHICFYAYLPKKSVSNSVDLEE